MAGVVAALGAQRDESGLSERGEDVPDPCRGGAVRAAGQPVGEPQDRPVSPGAVRGCPSPPCRGRGAPPPRDGRVAPRRGGDAGHIPVPPGGGKAFRTPGGAVSRIRPIADPSRSGHGRITRIPALPAGALRACCLPMWSLTCGFTATLRRLVRGTHPCCADSGWCVRFAGPAPSWPGVGPLGVSSEKETNASIRVRREKNGRDNLDKLLSEFRR